MMLPTPKQRRMHEVIAALEVYRDTVNIVPPRFLVLGKQMDESGYFAICDAFHFDALDFLAMLPRKSIQDTSLQDFITVNIHGHGWSITHGI